jgi:hypothetical protein
MLKFLLTLTFLSIGQWGIAQDLAPAIEEINSVKKDLIKVHNHLSKMSDRSWNRVFMRAHRQTLKAKINDDTYLMLSDPSWRPYVLEELKLRVDELSQNGLILLFVNPYRDKKMEGEREEGRYYHSGIDIPFLILVILTLDGESVDNF